MNSSESLDVVKVPDGEQHVLVGSSDELFIESDETITPSEIIPFVGATGVTEVIVPIKYTNPKLSRTKIYLLLS